MASHRGGESIALLGRRPRDRIEGEAQHHGDARADEEGGATWTREGTSDGERRSERDDEDARASAWDESPRAVSSERGASAARGGRGAIARAALAAAAALCVGTLAAVMVWKSSAEGGGVNGDGLGKMASLGKKSSLSSSFESRGKTVRAARGSSFTGTAVDLDPASAKALRTWHQRKHAEASLGRAFHSGALEETGAFNPVLEGANWRTGSRGANERRHGAAARSSLKSEYEEIDYKDDDEKPARGKLGDVPEFMKHAASSDVAMQGLAAGATGSAATTCDMTKCSTNFQVIDPACDVGGIGCVGSTGCRFCKVVGREEEGAMADQPEIPTCNSCVCEHHGFTEGCAGMKTATSTPTPATPTPTPALTPTPTPALTPTPAEPAVDGAPDIFTDAGTEDETPTVAGQGESTSVVAVEEDLGAAARTCNFNVCDAKLLYSMYDPVCKQSGGLGCLGDTGCRFCKTDHQDESISYEEGWPRCPTCICDKYSIEGCVGGAPAVPVGTAAQPQATQTQSPAVQPRAEYEGREDADQGIPTPPVTPAAQPVVQPMPQPAAQQPAAQPQEAVQPQQPEQPAAQPQEAVQPQQPEQPAAPAQPPVNVDPGRFAAAGMGAMEESGPVDAIPSEWRITAAGVEWVQTEFGKLQTCQERCTMVQKSCVEHSWPNNMNDLRDVASRTTAADGKGGVVACKEILMNDKTEHCGGVAALSGRCFLSPSHGHLPASCTYAPKNSDCTHMCPCA